MVESSIDDIAVKKIDDLVSDENSIFTNNLSSTEQNNINTVNDAPIENNVNRKLPQADTFIRFFGILFNFPLFSSITRAGFASLFGTFILPRFLCEMIFYPIFRLVFGTLYPAYASYKAVRNKDVKEYVSLN